MPLQPELRRSGQEARELKRDYEIGKVKVANVGEVMIKFQDFWIETAEEPVVIPKYDIKLSGGPVVVDLVANNKYPIRGKITDAGVDYSVVALTENPISYNAVLLRSDGFVHDRVVAVNPQVGGVIMVVYKMAISPAGAKLEKEQSRTTKTAKGYENFEILYTGANSNGINLTYREFSPEGMARVAFFQNLTYPSDAKSITFKKYKIEVLSASSENINFKVISDGEVK